MYIFIHKIFTNDLGTYYDNKFVWFYFRDKATNEAILQEQVKVMQNNQIEILKKLEDNDLRWDNQQEQNGKVTMYIMLDSRQ